MRPAGSLPSLGVHLPDTPPDWRALGAFEQRVGVSVEIVSFYWSWGLDDSSPAFAWIEAILRDGRMPLVTWEPWRLPPSPDPSRSEWFNLARLLAGDFDAYIDSWGGRLRDLGGPVLLRLMHEMNGSWYPWCGTTNGNTPEMWGDAWRHVHARIAGTGARGVQWIWSPYAISVPDTSRNAIGRYYPGDAFVDWIALDGYNWGTTRPWSRWQTFDELFGPAHDVVTRLGSAPLLLAEVGSAEDGGNKARWIADAADALRTRYARVRGLVWFDLDKECDWRIESSAESLEAFRRSWRGVAA